MFIDTLVFGIIFLQSGTKATCVLRISPDALRAFDTGLLAAFWDIKHIEHTEMLRLLKGTEMERLKGVCSQITVLSKFTDQYNRTLMLDSDMIVRSNIDDVFKAKVPAAVMRQSMPKKREPANASCRFSLMGTLTPFSKRA